MKAALANVAGNMAKCRLVVYFAGVGISLLAGMRRGATLRGQDAISAVSNGVSDEARFAGRTATTLVP